MATSASASTTRRFRFERCLGRGGFGEVYLATMTSTGGLTRQVAVKVLRSDLDPRSQAVGRLRDEGQVLARLDHPVILGVVDLAILEGRVALVTELVPGEDLSGALLARDGLSHRALLEVVAEVAGALDAAWTAYGPDGRPLRLVHRDIKPSNIRLTPHGRVKLLDFGIAHFEAPDRHATTASHAIVGSLPYMAPERFGGPDAPSAADVYALGCVLYEGLTRAPLADRLTFLELSRMAADPANHRRYIAGRLAPLSSHHPPHLVDLLESCLAYEPERRPSAAEVGREAEALAERLGGLSLRAWCRAHPWPPAGSGEGPLVGRDIVEGAAPSVDPSGGPQPAQLPVPAEETTPFPDVTPLPPPERRRRSTLPLIALGILGFGTASAASLMAVRWLGVLDGPTPSEVQPAETPEAAIERAAEKPPVEEPSVEAIAEEPPPEAVAEEPPLEEVAVAPEDPVPAPVLTRAPVRSPAPVVEEPVPPEVEPEPVPIAPPPPPPAPKYGAVDQLGGHAFLLVAADGSKHVPGRVLAGTYRVWSRFGGVLQEVGEVTVEPDAALLVDCSDMLQRCDVRQKE